MADGGKPLAEAKIKLSVEGAPQVQQELKGAATEAQATGKAMGGAAEETKKVDASAKGATKSASDLTSGFRRLIGTATGVVGALFAVGRAIQGVAGYIDFLTNKTKELDEIVKKNGGLVPGTGDAAQRQLDEIRERLEQVNAELAETLDESGSVAQAIGGPVAGLAKLIDVALNGTGRLRSTIEGEKAALEQQADALQRRLQTERDIADAARRRLMIEKETLSTMTEEEKQIKRLDDLDKLKEGATEEERRRIEAIKRRVEEEIKAQRQADAEKREADRKASDARIRDIVNESKEAIEQDRKRIREEESARIRAQQSVFDAARRESERSLQAIAVTTAQATQLLRAINTSQSGGQPWQ